MKTAVLLIPHYNNPKGLLNSLKSIDHQEEIDVLIVDDGSQDNKIDEAITNAAFKAKGQVLYEYIPQNKGIEFALNRGLEIIKEKNYQFIARLDCGDICLGKRFSIQMAFLKNNPDIKIVGTNVKAVDTNDKFLYNIRMPETNEEIQKKMYLNCMLIHPTVMFSSDVFFKVPQYPTAYKSAEDYAFFFEIIKHYKAANLGGYLNQIEINEAGISITRRKLQVKNRINIIRKHFYLGFYPIYGLIRSYILLYLPYQIIFFLKKIK